MIPYGRQSIDDEDVQAVVDVLRGAWLTQGPNVEAFERAVAEACDVPHAVAFSSGTAALHGAMFAAGVEEGDEVVTSAITFAASANCAAYRGATPVFADIDFATWNLTADTVEAALTRRTKAIVPVHFAGLAAPVDEIRDVVGPDVKIIEDAAHALGSWGNGEPIGSCSHADMATFSFHPVKAITTGEGGMVTTRDPDLRDALVRFRSHGFIKDPERLERQDGGWYAEQQDLGFNYRLSDIHAALGGSQMRRLAAFVERRNVVAEAYRRGLADVEDLILPPAAGAGDRHAYHLFVIHHSGGLPARKQLYEQLHDRGIQVQVHYLPVYRHPWYRRTFGYAPGSCQMAERYYEGCLSLPCFPSLDDSDQARVITAIRELVG